MTGAARCPPYGILTTAYGILTAPHCARLPQFMARDQTERRYSGQRRKPLEKMGDVADEANNTPGEATEGSRPCHGVLRAGRDHLSGLGRRPGVRGHMRGRDAGRDRMRPRQPAGAPRRALRHRRRQRPHRAAYRRPRTTGGRRTVRRRDRGRDAADRNGPDDAEPMAPTGGPRWSPRHRYAGRWVSASWSTSAKPAR